MSCLLDRRGTHGTAGPPAGRLVRVSVVRGRASGFRRVLAGDYYPGAALGHRAPARRRPQPAWRRSERSALLRVRRPPDRGLAAASPRRRGRGAHGGRLQRLRGWPGAAARTSGLGGGRLRVRLHGHPRARRVVGRRRRNGRPGRAPSLGAGVCHQRHRAPGRLLLPTGVHRRRPADRHAARPARLRPGGGHRSEPGRRDRHRGRRAGSTACARCCPTSRSEATGATASSTATKIPMPR